MCVISTQVDSRPVVFYQKDLVQEMLKKQKMRFHLSSCHLPKLRNMEKNTNNTKSKYNTSIENLSSLNGKHGRLSKNVSKKSFLCLNDQLELKGNAMVNRTDANKLVNGAGKFPEEHCNDKNLYTEIMCNTTDEDEVLLQNKDTRVQSCYKHTSTNVSRERNLSMSEKTSSFVQNQYVDIPVSLPNPALTDESCSIISEARDLNSEIISLEIKTDQKCNKPFDEERYSRNETKCFSDNTDSGLDMKSMSHVETAPCNDLGKVKLTKRENETNPGFDPSGSHEDRLPSRLTYTPSTPPLFLSDEVYELPKGVSPSKALIELRQTFCENIRRETTQLEFDLQELYLKKQLHQR
jgi:hypothetical protein